jgi:hypothetical protein
MVISGEGDAQQQLCAAIARSGNVRLDGFKKKFLPGLEESNELARTPV